MNRTCGLVMHQLKVRTLVLHSLFFFILKIQQIAHRWSLEAAAVLTGSSFVKAISNF